MSLELLLDAEFDARIRAEWGRLQELGLPSQASHTGASNRPHVTLAVRDALPHEGLAAITERLPLAVSLGAPVIFGSGDRRILARSVVMTEQLLDLHRRLHELVGPGDDAPFTVPDEWTPHVTLARRISASDLAAAVATVEGSIEADLSELRHWDATTKTVTPAS